ncbi:MscS mechanosensitive ion channel [Shewanella sediminis HAW-EB3]|uniref:Small-conductance mechanosensitive channel n=1 Tax=Shewanella sediminis (strain HAW-EB3) TaxID=425104 RepID=A8FQV2_SHESH|nr:mechanosensitive ion channel family protein [Shewanella sediminis]ABV35225.1 MscS mechanosensitive ion channel [Shewanella sediminis HAW-EB3]
MYRILSLVMLTIIGLSGMPSQAQTPTPPLTEPSIETTAEAGELSSLQDSITLDVNRLKLTKGELTSFTEYRIKKNAQLLHLKLQELMDETPLNSKLLLPLVREHLDFINRVDIYYTDDIKQLRSELGKDNDAAIMMQLSLRERERDAQLEAKLDTLKWAEKLEIDTGNQADLLIKTLVKRADKLNSLVQYTQEKLQAAVSEASLAGSDVTSEQTLLVTQLNERLAQSSSSLAVAIGLLDIVGQDTAELKQTLFSTSGDITQDVLNIDVASSLIEQWFTAAKTQAIDNGPGVIFKLFIFVLILFVANLAGKLAQKIVKKTVSNSKLQFSLLLQEFFISLSGKAVFTLGVLIALSQLGIELGPLLAGFGVAGVIIGFALQDTLSNFASGMMILIYRPYDVGDLINAAGVTGKVSHMSLVSTTIKTLDNQRLIIPNNKIWGDTINNITVEHQRRVDMTFGIGYGDDIEKAERVMNAILLEHPKVLKNPEPIVKLHTLGESSVDFVVRPWAKPEDYWEVYWDVTRTVKMRFDAENISIPFPQRDVHIYQSE